MLMLFHMIVGQVSIITQQAQETPIVTLLYSVYKVAIVLALMQEEKKEYMYIF